MTTERFRKVVTGLTCFLETPALNLSEVSSILNEACRIFSQPLQANSMTAFSPTCFISQHIFILSSQSIVKYFL
jgi:hypothetical protein